MPPLPEDAFRLSAPSGMPLDRALRARHPQASWGEVRRAVTRGKVEVEGERVTEPARWVPAGSEIRISPSARVPDRAGALPEQRVVFVDRHVVVVNKPTGLSSVPYDERERDTLADRLPALLKRLSPTGRGREELGVVHRLDKETSGLLVFARTLAAKRTLAQQFRFHTVTRRYVAVVHGRPREGRIESFLVKDRGDGLRGSTRRPGTGSRAVTHVRVLSGGALASRVECRLETGRTHQIRIHLSEAGHPLVGERVYVRGFPGPLLPSGRLLLHAEELGFVHPATGRTLAFHERPPEDFEDEWRALSGAG